MVMFENLHFFGHKISDFYIFSDINLRKITLFRTYSFIALKRPFTIPCRPDLSKIAKLQHSCKIYRQALCLLVFVIIFGIEQDTVAYALRKLLAKSI